jgi:hypothetical protein
MPNFGTFTPRTRHRDNTRAFYPEKLSPPVTLSLTKAGLAALKRVVKRTERSRGDIYERLLRLHAHTLKKGGVPQYAGKMPMPVALSLTQLGLDILNETQKRVARSRGDIFEDLLLAHGDTLEFPEPQPEPAAAETGAQA